MRKKWTALCMVFVMLFALTGCGSSTKVVDLVTNNVNGKNSSETTKTNKTETEAGTKVIAAKDIKDQNNGEQSRTNIKTDCP